MSYITGPVPERFQREVAASPAEFERDLHKAWPQGEVQATSPNCFVLNDGALQLSIRIEPISPRTIGLLTLPRLLADYQFDGADAEHRAKLLKVLDRAMQRGGG